VTEENGRARIPGFWLPGVQRCLPGAHRPSADLIRQLHVELHLFADEPRIAALFLNSPIANLPQVIREELVRVGYPAWLAPGGLLAARLVTGQNIVARSPLTEIQQVGGRPIFITHSADDQRVAIHRSYQKDTFPGWPS
jgi:hypothetical protein